MKKEKLSTWKAIKKQYPDEWVLIVDVVTDKATQIKKAIVKAHGKTRDEVAQHPANTAYSVSGILYTGELLPKNFVFML